MRVGTWSTPGNRSRWAVILLITLTGMLVSGCLRANVSMSISGDDLVTGTLRIATQTSAGATPLRLKPPADLADRVHVRPFESGRNSGSELSFTNLSFAEVERLGTTLSGSGSRYKFHIERSGSIVTLRGSVDLTPLADTDSTVLIELTAPGEPTSTNGQESAGVITWDLEPGEVTTLSATYQFTGGATQPWMIWALAVVGLTLGVALLVAALALVAHKRMRRAAGDRHV